MGDRTSTNIQMGINPKSKLKDSPENLTPIKHENCRRSPDFIIHNHNFPKPHPLPCLPHISKLPPLPTLLQLHHCSIPIILIHRKNTWNSPRLPVPPHHPKLLLLSIPNQEPNTPCSEPRQPIQRHPLILLHIVPLHWTHPTPGCPEHRVPRTATGDYDLIGIWECYTRKATARREHRWEELPWISEKVEAENWGRRRRAVEREGAGVKKRATKNVEVGAEGNGGEVAEAVDIGIDGKWWKRAPS